MNLWFVWPFGIATWLFVGWVVFGIFERLGLKHDNAAGYVTLSYFVYRVTQAWPPAVFLIGLFVGLFWGILCAHLWWHWCPPGSVSTGALTLPYSLIAVWQ
jgi:hypothetical protein